MELDGYGVDVVLIFIVRGPPFATDCSLSRDIFCDAGVEPRRQCIFAQRITTA